MMTFCRGSPIKPPEGTPVVKGAKAPLELTEPEASFTATPAVVQEAGQARPGE